MAPLLYGNHTTEQILFSRAIARMFAAFDHYVRQQISLNEADMDLLSTHCVVRKLRK